MKKLLPPGKLRGFYSKHQIERQVLPVQQNTIRRWMNGEVRAWEISAEDVLPYIPRSSVECIMMTGSAPQGKGAWETAR